MKKPWYQTLYENLGWLILGIFFLGSLLDTFVNAFQVITPAITYFGSALFIITYVVLQLILRYRGLPWRVEIDRMEKIISLRRKPFWILLGLLTTLWLPRVINLSSISPTSQHPEIELTSPAQNQTSETTNTQNVAKGICGGTSTTLQVPSNPPDLNWLYGFTMYQPENSKSTTGEPLIGKKVQAVFADEEGIWFGSSDFPDGKGRLIFISNPLDKDPVGPARRTWEICQDPKGLLIGTQINSIAKDDEGNLWVATDGTGVWRLQDNLWEQHVFDQTSDPSGLPNKASYTIVPYLGSVYIGTLSGVVQYNGINWTARTDIAGRDQVLAIAFDKNGGTWVDTNEGVRFVHPDGSVENFTTENGLVNNYVKDIFIEDSLVWIATWGGGISVYENGSWTSHRAQDKGIPSDNVADLDKDNLGRMWAGTDKGIAYFDGDQWKLYSDLNTHSISFGRSGKERCPDAVDIWTGTDAAGLTNSRIPAGSAAISSIEISGIPTSIAPGDVFTPTVVVTLEKGFILQGGDFLHVIDERQFTVSPQVGLQDYEFVPAGQPYAFDFRINPFTAPVEPGTYSSTWRLWQCTRYIGPPIVLKFAVESP